MTKRIQVTDQIRIGGNKRFTLIAGPCAIESEKMTLEVADTLQQICRQLKIDFIFKSSFDKANRTSIHAPRGVGMNEGLRILQKVKNELGIPIITDVHESWHCMPVAEVADIIQIPAFLSRQTDLLLAAAKTGRIIHVKKAQFMAPHDMLHVIRKLEEAGNYQIMIGERGTSFGYNNLVVDMTGLVEMRSFGYPVVFDATHSVQKPGGLGNSSGGNREMVPYLMRAALAVGVDAIFAEVHPDPNNAFSDGPNQLRLKDVATILRDALRVDEVTKSIMYDYKTDATDEMIVCTPANEDLSKPTFQEKISRIKVFLTDVDGVLTDGGMYYEDDGKQMKKFHAHDGMALQMIRRKGIITGFITSEETKLVEDRFRKLKLHYLYQGKREGGKLAAAQEICSREGVSMDEIAYIGDDVNCMELLQSVGIAACPADAVRSIKNIPGILIMNKNGGEGCVREFIEKLFPDYESF